MAAPTLTDYQYQYGDSGFLINGGASLPFIDVDKVTGLDTPSIEVKDIDYDSQHGGYVYARFVSSRTIVIDGTLYANPITIDSTLQTLRNNFIPTLTDSPLYIKEPGLSQQYIMCKPIGFNYDVDRLRSYGACKIQIQLKAGDPVRYIDDADTAFTAGTNYSITNAGNVETWPKFITTGPFTEMAVVNNTTGQTVGFVYTADDNDDIVLDFKTRSLLINDVNQNGLLTSIGWWPLLPGVATSFKVFSIGANTMTNPDTESNYTTGYSVGSSWTGTQGYTTDKHKGTRSLRMVRNSKTAANGSVTIPTGITGLVAGSYTCWAWIKGTMPKVTMRVRNGGTDITSVVLTDNSSTAWKKIQFTFTLAATSGAIDFVFQDTGQAASVYKKNQTLLIDDMGVAAINASSFTGTVKTKDGWI